MSFALSKDSPPPRHPYYSKMTFEFSPQKDNIFVSNLKAFSKASGKWWAICGLFKMKLEW